MGKLSTTVKRIPVVIQKAGSLVSDWLSAL